MSYRAVCQTCGYVGSDFSVSRVLAQRDGEAHEVAVSVDPKEPSHRTKVVSGLRGTPTRNLAERVEERDEAPGCFRCYLATGETIGQLWDPEDEDWVCPKHDLGRPYPHDVFTKGWTA